MALELRVVLNFLMAGNEGRKGRREGGQGRGGEGGGRKYLLAHYRKCLPTPVSEDYWTAGQKKSGYVNHHKEQSSSNLLDQ